MRLNRKIIKAIDQGYEQQNTERFVHEDLMKLNEVLYSEELTIADFAALAHIYDVPYKFKIFVHGKTNIITDENILHYELDKIYYELTSRRLNSFRLTLTEVTEKFNAIHVLIVLL